jgi:hypothetical protein
MKKKLDIGGLYKIRFYDHVAGHQDLVVCEVSGWVIEQDKEKVAITYWQLLNESEKTARDNIEPVALIRSAIISCRKLL